MKLNAGLQILVIPLKASTFDDAADGLSITADPDSGEGPFLPARLYDSESSMVGGELRLLATATYPVVGGGSELWFGHSQGTMDDDRNEPIWSGPAAACISLWWTIQGLAMTLERVASLDEQLQNFDIYSGEPFAGLSGLESAVNRILSGTGLAADSTIRDLLGGAEVLAGSTGHGTVLTQCIESPQSYRNTKLIEGLLVRVEPSASRRVADQINPLESDEDAFDLADSEQSIAIPWKWHAAKLVDEPVESGATIAIREDGRCILLNLEAMSVYHDYDGHGGRHLVIACIPEVARIGAMADHCSTITGILTGGTMHPALTTREGLDNLEKTRDTTEAFRRQEMVVTFERGFVISEKFKTWTHGGQLVPILWTYTENRVNHMADDLRAMTSMVTEMIDTDIQRTTVRLQSLEEERSNRRLARVAYESGAIGIGALALLVGLFMTIAMAPAWNGKGTVNMWPWSFVLVAATVAIGIGVGWLFRKIRDGKPSK